MTAHKHIFLSHSFPPAYKQTHTWLVSWNKRKHHNHTCAPNILRQHIGTISNLKENPNFKLLIPRTIRNSPIEAEKGEI